MSGTTTWQAMRTIAAVTPNTLFPAACKMANGDVILVTPRMSNHLAGDGEIWKLTGVDNGDGTVTWRNDWTKIYARQGSTWDCRSGLPALVPSGPHAGKVVVAIADTNWLSSTLATDYLSPWPTVSVQCFTRILISTDETCTAWELLATLPPSFPDLAPNCNDFPEAPVVFLPNGDWMIACYTRETHDYIGWYSSSYWRSINDGEDWEHEGFISRANTANSNQSTAYMADEPQLLMLQNGEMICVIRVLLEGRNESINGYEHHLFRCTNPTDRGAMVWTNEGACTVSMAASRPALLQHSNGMVLHGFRVIAGSGSVSSAQGAWRVSDDDAATTWGAERNLDTGGLTSGISGTGVYSYGAWVELDDGSLIHVYCNDNYTASTTREARFSVVSFPSATGYGNTVSAGYGDAEAYRVEGLLTIDPASTAWEQIDTSVIVRCTSDPSTVEATIVSAEGGLVRFRGTDADLFEVSLDGTAWASAVDVDAGETTIHLRVTPEAPGTTLTAEIGVPV